MKQTGGITAQIRIVSARLEAVLKKLTESGITLLQIEKVDDLTAKIRVKTSDYKETAFLLDKWKESFQLLDQQESALFGRKLFSRMVLIIALVFLLCVSLYLPGKIMFVYVVGNETVPARRIIEEANAKGVCFGAAAADVRSEKVKNALLEAIPELQWIGVNTSGCVATIHVEEKSDTLDSGDTKYGVSSIVASKDGIIETCTVTKGTRLCKEGQAVKEGQTLISGYTDCGIIIKATQADGEVFAQTLRKIDAVLPRDYLVKGSAADVSVNYALRVGKKLINFDNNSGIYDGSCAKIYEEQYMMLPGGFLLPVSLIKETVISYDRSDASAMELDAGNLLESYSESYLLSQMVAGTVKDKTLQITETATCTTLKGQYVCSEMIGRQKIEDILQGENKS